MTAARGTDTKIIGYAHLQTEASSVSVPELILMRVRLRARRRAAWLARLAGTSLDGTATMFEGALKACIDDRDTPEAEADWFDSAEEIQSINDSIDSVEELLAEKERAGLRPLADLFGLSQPELDLLQMCLAFQLD